MTTFLHERTGFIEPLVAVYEPGALQLLQQAGEQDVRQLNVALPAEMRHHVPVQKGMARAFFNINYPADLELLKELEQVRESRDESRDAQGSVPC
jgi:molybdenum cofactor guanylyltransferase